MLRSDYGAGSLGAGCKGSPCLEAGTESCQTEALARAGSHADTLGFPSRPAQTGGQPRQLTVRAQAVGTARCFDYQGLYLREARDPHPSRQGRLARGGHQRMNLAAPTHSSGLKVLFSHCFSRSLLAVPVLITALTRRPHNYRKWDALENVVGEEPPASLDVRRGWRTG